MESQKCVSARQFTLHRGKPRPREGKDLPKITQLVSGKGRLGLRSPELSPCTRNVALHLFCLCAILSINRGTEQETVGVGELHPQDFRNQEFRYALNME